MVTFEYDGKIYKPSNLEKKLKKLGVTINDVKILDDTQTKAEKELEEKQQQKEINKSETYNLRVYWDTTCKGWYIYDKNFPLEPATFSRFWDNVVNKKYIFIGETNGDHLSDFAKEHWKNVINGIFPE